MDPEGLVTIYSPVSPIQSVAPAVTIGSDVSSKVISKVMAGHRKKINTEVAPTTTKSPTAVSTPQHCAAMLSPHNLLSVLHYGQFCYTFFVCLMLTHGVVYSAVYDLPRL